MPNLFSRQRGDGRVLLFIHGFPMHQAVWDDFAQRFTDSHKVITIDLPGFGESPILSDSFSIDQVAEQVIHFILEMKISNVALIGHSLGGYVGLSMISKRPDLFSGFVLFHSTAFADSDEKKQSRDKAVDFIEKNGVLAFTSNFIAPLFADPSSKSIQKVKEISSHSTKDAVIGYTKAMRNRPDQIKTLKSFKKPTLFLAGEKDQGIPVESIHKQATNCQYPEIHILQDVGHMGMFEKPEEAASKIKHFLNKI
jgi:pimeloyl-ACP methyl ester carboxylesterase